MSPVQLMQRYFQSLISFLSDVDSMKSLLVGLLLLFLLFVSSFLTDALTKDILHFYPFPLTLTLAQFIMSTIGALLVCTVNQNLYVPSWKKLLNIIPIVFVHLVGFVSTNLSLALLPVSFTHTIKASESLFTAAVSRLWLGMEFTTYLYLSLIPIVVGVAVSSASEISFDLFGLIAALISNACFAWRSVLAQQIIITKRKRKLSEHSVANGSHQSIMTTTNSNIRKNDSINKIYTSNGNRNNSSSTEILSFDDINLYFYISLLSSILILPIWLKFEYFDLPPILSPAIHSINSFNDYYNYTDVKINIFPYVYSFTQNLNEGETVKLPLTTSLYNNSPPSAVSSTLSASGVFNLNVGILSVYLFCLIFNGFGHYLYNQCSFLLLSRVAAITHVVIHACRRVFVIYLSVVWLGHSLTYNTIIGTLLVVAGVIWFAVEKSNLKNQQIKETKME